MEFKETLNKKIEKVKANKLITKVIILYKFL